MGNEQAGGSGSRKVKKKMKKSGLYKPPTGLLGKEITE